MKKRYWIASLFLAGCAIVIWAQHQSAQAIQPSYSAAFISENQLHVFPFAGQAVNIPLPFKPGTLAYSPDGGALYTGTSFSQEQGPGILRISLQSGGFAKIPGSETFGPIFSLAVSAAEDKIVIAGGHQRSDSTDCGIFELDIATRSVRPLMLQHDAGCQYPTAWGDVSLSTNGKAALAEKGRDGEVRLIDLERGSYRPIGKAANARISPDGEYIALVDTSRNVSLLLGTSDFSKSRSLGKYDGPTLVWSPDSKYLLLWESGLGCGFSFGYYGTFSALDVQTGARIPINSSRCRIYLMTGGWVSNKVLP